MAWDDLGDLEHQVAAGLAAIRLGSRGRNVPEHHRSPARRNGTLSSSNGKGSCCRRYAVNAALPLWGYSPRPFWSQGCVRLKFAGNTARP